MRLTNLALLTLIVPALAMGSIGCAGDAGDDSASGEDAMVVQAGLQAELGGAVGALVVNGQKLCTAALVTTQAGAMLQVNGAQVAAEGRQVVFGGACVGKLSQSQRGFLGAAAFVSVKGGVTLSTPIVGFDFESQASAGLAVGILGARSQATPIDFVGVAAQADVGASGGAFIRANDANGLVTGGGFEVHGGFDVAIGTACTSFRAGASASVGAGASLQLRGGDDAAAIIRVNGRLHFAAYLDVKVDGQCIVSKTVEHLSHFEEEANSAGVADIASMQYHPGSGHATMSVYLKEPSLFIRINSGGKIDGQTDGIKCHKLPFTGGPCELYNADGFAKGWHDIDVDLGIDLFGHGQRGQLVVFSTTDEPYQPGVQSSQN